MTLIRFSLFTIPLLGLTLFYSEAQAQRIELKSIEIKEGKLQIRYNLIDTIAGKFYSIRLYSSADGFLNPLEKTQGDIGLEVKAGGEKIISWTFQQELPKEFEGKVAVEIRAKVFIPFINTESINQYKVFKRNRGYNLTWKGGTPQNVLNFDLLDGNKKVITFPNVANVGHHSFEFPSHIKPGKGYRFRISDTKNKDEVVFTNEFIIKRKVPLLVKIVPVLFIGAGIYLLVPTGSGDEDDLPKAPVDNLPTKS
jgi:hypothetical protein